MMEIRARWLIQRPSAYVNDLPWLRAKRGAKKSMLISDRVALDHRPQAPDEEEETNCYVIPTSCCLPATGAG